MKIEYWICDNCGQRIGGELNVDFDTGTEQFCCLKCSKEYAKNKSYSSEKMGAT